MLQTASTPTSVVITLSKQFVWKAPTHLPLSVCSHTEIIDSHSAVRGLQHSSRDEGTLQWHGWGTPRSPLQTLSAPKPKKEVGMTLTQINLFNPSYLQVWFPLRARRKDADPTWQAGPQDVGLI